MWALPFQTLCPQDSAQCLGHTLTWLYCVSWLAGYTWGLLPASWLHFPFIHTLLYPYLQLFLGLWNLLNSLVISMIVSLVFHLIKLPGFWGQTHACSHSKWHWAHRSRWINICCKRLKLFEEFLSNLMTKVPPLFWISRHVSLKKDFLIQRMGWGCRDQVNVLKLCPRKEGSIR